MSMIDAPAGIEADSRRSETANRDVTANGAAIAQQPGGDAKAAALFQKAYQEMVALNRIDEQLSSMLSQRRSLQAELKDLQGQINGAFKRLLEESSQTPQRLLQEIADHADA
jgi:hypothetical protein